MFSHLVCMHALQALAAFYTPEELGEAENHDWQVLFFLDDMTGN